MQVVERDITGDPQARALLKERYGRVAAPAIVVGERVFWGFDANREELAELMGVDDDGLTG